MLDGISDPEPVNLAYGSRVDLLELIALLESIVGHPLPVDHVEPRAGDVRHSRPTTPGSGRCSPTWCPCRSRTAFAATVEWMAGRTDP